MQAIPLDCGALRFDRGYKSFPVIATGWIRSKTPIVASEWPSFDTRYHYFPLVILFWTFPSVLFRIEKPPTEAHEKCWICRSLAKFFTDLLSSLDKWRVTMKLLFLLILSSYSFKWSLNDGNSSQISWTLLSILADFRNAVVLIVFYWFLIHPVPSPSLYGLFQVHQLLLVSPSSSGSAAFLFLW